MSIAAKLADNFSGPIIFNYVWWMLRQAQERSIDRLYFLARDGYTLKKVAEMFCERFGLDIECRYLHCSRAALRGPTYFFIGDEALDLLLMWGYSVTLRSVLSRADLGKDERNEIYGECGLLDVAENRPLTKPEFEQYAGRLRKSAALRRYLCEGSRAAYDGAIGYFRQEGLFDRDTVAVVDSGWTGSIQRSLRQLLEFAGYEGRLTGFYFGMNEYPKSPADGEYLTWYFDAGTKAGDRAVFCNNLFECLLSAPHGMTKGYKKEGARYVPVLTPQPSEDAAALIREQSAAICRYCEERIKWTDFSAFLPEALRRDTAGRIRRHMFTPTLAEAAYYGNFLFCDDTTELYHSPLASDDQTDIIKRNSFLPKRILQKMAHVTPAKGVSEMYWAYGTIAFMPRGRWWYRWNVYGWEWLKCAAKRRRAPRGGDRPQRDWFALADGYDAVSFDVFDTLVYRTVNRPADVFYLMEPWAEKELGIAGFHDKRVAAEQEARRRSSREDVTLLEIYKAMAVSDETAARLMEQEESAELAVIRGDELMVSLFRYCVERGKRVLVITDMYQSEGFIRAVLSRAGLGGGYSLYVSSAEGCTKHSGSLFRHVAAREGISDRGTWLHIGDNEYADCYMAKKNGVRAARYENGRTAAGQKTSTVAVWIEKIKRHL